MSLKTTRNFPSYDLEQLQQTPGAPHLFWRQDGNVVVIDAARLLLDGALVDFLFEVLAGQPEEHVLLAVLCSQELPEDVPSRRVPHQLVKGLRPQTHLLHRRLGAEGRDVPYSVSHPSIANVVYEECIDAPTPPHTVHILLETG